MNNTKVSLIEPIPHKGFVLYNKEVFQDKYSCSFTQIHKGNDLKYCDKGAYYTKDPRTYDVMRNTRMGFDRPPIVGSASLYDNSKNVDNSIRSEYLNNYGNRNMQYKNYSSVNAGQIMYYNDKSIQDAYFNPLFFNKAVVEKEVYTTPMGTTWVTYNRHAADIYKNDSCLTSITDQSEFREDIMAQQMRPQNRVRYTLNYN